MNNPFLWLGLSILLVAISLMALLVVAVLTLQELARAARSAEKLLDTLNREMPATLQDLRLTGKEISVLTDEVTGGMQSARSVVQQVDQGLVEAKTNAKRAQVVAHVTTHSFLAGAATAIRTLAGKPRKKRRSRPPTRRPPIVSSPEASSPEVSSPVTTTTHPATSDNSRDSTVESSANLPASVKPVER